jgi:hypothetical protein
MCTSSIIYTLYLHNVGTRFILLFKSLISSTPLLEAASISIISFTFSFLICLQMVHSPQGKPSFGFKQLIALANILAILVFPVPLGPLRDTHD